MKSLPLYMVSTVARFSSELATRAVAGNRGAWLDRA